jgi:Protein of unknown function (DUF3311)
MRSHKSRIGWSSHWPRLLLVIPFLAVLWVPSNRIEPSLAGIPFFYWYQLAWVLLGAAVVLAVYLIEMRATGAGSVMARLQRVGREMRMLVENTDDQTIADPGLLRIVARAHEIQERLMQNTDLTVHITASQERVSANYVYRLLRLPTLAPDIITAVVNGKNPPQLTAKKLMRLTPQIPVDWAEQRKLLGFQQR